MKGGYYRPMYLHTLKAGLDAQGNIVGWQHRIVGQSILAGTAFESMMVKDGIDRDQRRGRVDAAVRDSATSRSSCTRRSMGVPVQWWRSVGSTHTAFSTETFIDELAVGRGQGSGRSSAARCSPSIRATWRRSSSPRTRPAGARRSPPASAGDKRGRGVAVHESFNTVVAQVAEVTVDDGQQVHASIASCARSTAASRSTRTSCARRWKAASASACRRRCTARSR